MRRPLMITGYEKPKLRQACHRTEQLALVTCRRKSATKRRPLTTRRSVAPSMSRGEDGKMSNSLRKRKIMCRSRIGSVRNQTADQHINKLESLERLSPEVGPANGKQFLLHVPLFVLFDIYAERFSEQIHILPTRTCHPHKGHRCDA